MRFILASSSPRRRELIASLGITFEVIKPDIDESQREGEHPLDYVKRLSREKAVAVATKLRSEDVYVLAADTIVLAADTIGVELGDIPAGGTILGKPANADEARTMLVTLRERPHMVYTAFCLLSLSSGEQARAVEDLVGTEVLMRDYTDAEMEAYIQSGDPFDKAGGYAIQNAEFHPVAEIDGCYTNVVGLPLCAVKRALAKFGWYGLGVSEVCDCPPYIEPV